MAIDGAKQRTTVDGRLFDPRLHGADRTRLGVRSVRNPDFAADGVRIGFRPPQRHREAILPESAILNVKPYQFRPTKRASET